MKYNLITIVIFVILFTSCSSKKEEAKKHFINANKLFGSKDYLNALLAIDSALINDDNFLEAIELKAKIKISLKENEEAISILSTLIEKKYNLDTTNFLIANCYGVRIRNQSANNKEVFHKKALEYYDKTIQINPHFFRAYSNKIKSFINANKTDNAFEEINKAIKLFPSEYELYSLRGYILYCKEDYSSALIDLDKVISNEKLEKFYLAEAYDIRGRVFYKKKIYTNAIYDFTLSIQYDSTIANTFNNRALCYIKYNMLNKACADLRKGLELGEPNYEILNKYCNN